MIARHGARTAALFSAALALGACAGGHAAPPPAPEPAPVAVAIDPVHPPVQPQKKYVVVDVERNELRFMDGERVLWRAPVGTGTGFRLSTPTGRGWEFTTPTGTRYVQSKQLDPYWYRPDWWYHENKLRVPPAESPARKEIGGLGSAAVFLGDEIAIHGTDKPELLGRRVSHGCIRLSNFNALRLFHDVQVGTPVVIVGQAEVLGEQPDSVSRFTRHARATEPRIFRNPLDRVPTPALLARLDRQLAAADDSLWTLAASALLERGLKDDAPALRGLLERAGRPEPEPRRREYAQFLADAFSRGALRTVVSLNRIAPEAREKAVQEIVEATMALYHGPLGYSLAPWPTRRVPVSMLGPEGQAGWKALQDAEAAYRGRVAGVAAGTN